MKKHLTGIIIGICLTVTAGSVWYAYKSVQFVQNMQNAVISSNAQIQSQGSTIQAIIDFINKQAQVPQE